MLRRYLNYTTMGIRQPAAEKLARKLLELRAPRLQAPPDKFYEMMARVIMVYVDMDEQRQRQDKILNPPDAAKESE